MLEILVTWCIEMLKTSLYWRMRCVRPEVLKLFVELADRIFELHFNTQKSSKIDGLRHFAYQGVGLFYNGKSKEVILVPGSLKLGVHKWHDIGVFAGRGILIDYWAYAERHGKTYDATEAVAITYDELMACPAEKSQTSNQPIELRKVISC
ncbi:hypothetical protein BBP40_000140 [Aspergillus hancockii]|nr:hypothetical protein BBP40_000140 [Aspergillus hancockii]